MKQPLLSILIPTVVGREEQFEKLKNKLHIQTIGTGCEIQWICDNKEMTIGEKREKLYQQSNGLFSWQIDDDDEIAPNAIQLILEAIKSNPDVDVISFEEYCNMDGKEYKSNHWGGYSGWEGDGHIEFPDGFHFHRTPFFKSVIRTELTRSVPIQKIRFGEDHAFANDLHPLIKNEIHISEPLYRYIHISSDHNTRYGIKD